MAKFTVRAAVPDDIGDIMRIRTGVKENHLDREQLAALGITPGSLKTMMNSSHRAWCAIADDRVIGFAMAETAPGRVEAIFVEPDSEGQGVGTALLEACVAHLVAAGHRRLVLETGPGTRALYFYQARGWRLSGETKRDDLAMEFLVTPHGN